MLIKNAFWSYWSEHNLKIHQRIDGTQSGFVYVDKFKLVKTAYEIAGIAYTNIGRESLPETNIEIL